MTLSARELGDVCAELGPRLAGRPVQKVLQPDPATIVLGLRGQWLLLCADPRLGRAHPLEAKPSGSGDAAPAFCMLLRKELEGARLESLAAVAGERACELLFARGPERRRLRLFLYGRAAQLQLTDEEGSCLGFIGPARRPHSGLPAPRSREPQRAQLDADPDSRAEEGGGSTPPAEPTRFGVSPGVGERVAGHYAEAVRHAAGDRLRAQVGKQLEGEARRLERLLGGIERDLARLAASADRRKEADLLLAHLSEVPRGAAKVTLPDDFEGGQPLEIALDPSISPQKNAERRYREYARLRRGRAEMERRAGIARAALERVRSEQERLPSVEDAALDALAVPTRSSQRDGARRSKGARRPVRRPPYFAFRSATGATVLVGRAAERNDELTFQVARGSDLWLHARDVPGSHVVVRLGPGRSVDGETLLDAATLAAHFSSARGEPQLDVSYLPRKQVRKPPRSAPGRVSTAGSKTIRVRLEPARLARLLASRVDEES